MCTIFLSTYVPYRLLNHPNDVSPIVFNSNIKRIQAHSFINSILNISFEITNSTILNKYLKCQIILKIMYKYRYSYMYVCTCII